MKLKHLQSVFLTFMPPPHPLLYSTLSFLSFYFYPEGMLRTLLYFLSTIYSQEGIHTSSPHLHPGLELSNYIFPLGLFFLCFGFSVFACLSSGFGSMREPNAISLNARQMLYFLVCVFFGLSTIPNRSLDSVCGSHMAYEAASSH